MSLFPSKLGRFFALLVLLFSSILLLYELLCKTSCGYGLVIFNFPFFIIGQFLQGFTYPFLLLVFPTTLLFYMWIAYNIGVYSEGLTRSVPKRKKKKHETSNRIR